MKKIRAEDITLRGNAVSHVGDQRMETPFVLPEELFLPSKVIKKQGKTVFTLPNGVIEKSSERIQADCKHFGVCGACHYRHLPYEKSALLKRQLFEGSLQETGVEVPVNLTVAPNPLHYRNNARFHLHNKKLTQHTMLRHEEFVLEECFVMSESMWRTAHHLKYVVPPHVTDLEIRENAAGEQMVILTSKAEYLPEIKAHSVYRFDPTMKTMTHVAGEKELVHSLEVGEVSMDFAVGPESFFQVNTAVAGQLYEAIAEEMPDTGLVYDLYAGTGTIGITVAKIHPQLEVVSVERSAEMVRLGKTNAQKNGVENITFLEADIRHHRFTEKPEVIIVDPPRNGLAKDSLEHMMTLGAKKLVYVSCNPETFLRDMEVLKGAYTLTSVMVFDMMPYTSHMEVLGVFE